MWDYVMGIAQSARDLRLLFSGYALRLVLFTAINSWHCAITLIRTLTNLAKLSMTTVLFFFLYESLMHNQRCIQD